MEESEKYLTYQEYRSLGGTLDLMPFNLLEFEAERKIDERTQNRLKDVEEIPEEVKKCMFRLIDLMSTYDEQLSNATKGIASENIDGYSVSYITGSQANEIIKSKINEINDIITTYLFGVVVNGEHVLYLWIK